MLNNSSKRLLTTSLSIITIMIVIFGTVVAINLSSSPYSKPNTTNTLLLGNYLNSLQNSNYLSQSSTSASTTQNKIWIIHYDDSKTKILLLEKLLQLHVDVLSVLTTLPFITANMSQEQVTTLQTIFPTTIQFTANKEWQAFPKPENMTAITQTSQVPANYQSPREIIQANSLGNTTLGQNTTIAIIDTGIDYNHPAFNNLPDRIIFNESFVNSSYGYSNSESILDQNGHGTHVAGIAAGGGSGIFMGVAPDANLVILKVGTFLGYITTAGVLAAIDVAIQHHVDVINLSLGSSSSDPNDPISLAVDDAVAHGISVAVAAGNDGPGLGTVGTPASSRLAITVGASQGNSTVTSFSSRGPTSDNRIDPDVVAPGYNIIAPLASGSLTDLSNQYFTPSLAINTNYIAFSGTSMATPVVTGALALLKQLYPHLTPMALRSALMSSATSLGLPADVQGSGLVNVSRANQYLNANMNPSTNNSTSNTISFLPEQNILANFHMPHIIFPNDNYSMRLFVVSGANLSISVTTDNTTLFSKVFIPTMEDSYGFTTTMGYYKEILLSLAPGPTPVFGFYNGSLQISIKSNSGINENFTVYIGSFEIIPPRERILWPLFHSDSSTDPNNPISNYYNFSNFLRTENISLTTTNDYLNTDLLMSYNAVVLISPLTPFTPNELQSLQTYVAFGGHLIILGTYSSFFDFTNLNTFLSQYGVQFLGYSPINIQDTGISQNIISPEPSNLSLTQNPQSSSLLANVMRLSWFSGSFLNITNNNTIPLATVPTSKNQVGLAYFPGNSSILGSIFISGEQDLFTNQNFLSQNANSDVSTFVSNLMNTFFNYSSTELTVFSPPTIVPSGSNLIFGATFWNKTTLVQTSATNMTVTINGGAPINETFNTTLHYFVANISFPNAGLYTLHFSYNGRSVERVIKAYSSQVLWNLTMKTSGTITPDQLPYYLTNSDISSTIALGQQTTFTFTSNSTSSSSEPPILIISNIPILFYSITSFYQNVSAIYSTILHNTTYSSHSSNSTWTFTYTPSYSLPAGTYYVEAYQNLTSTEILSITSIFDGSFFVIDTPPPLIDLTKSTINGGASLSTYEVPANPQNTQILQPTVGSNVSLTIVAGQMGHSPLKVVVIVAPYYPFLDYNLEFSVSYLSSENATYFTGNIQMPNKTLYSLIGSKSDLTIANQLLVLYILLYDQYGNYDAFPVFMVLNQSSSNQFLSDAFAPLVIGLLLLGTFFFFLIYRSSRKRSSQDYYYQYYPKQPMNQYGPPTTQQLPSQTQPPQIPPSTPKYCPHCGSPTVPGANFCMECGKKIL